MSILSLEAEFALLSSGHGENQQFINISAIMNGIHTNLIRFATCTDVCVSITLLWSPNHFSCCYFHYGRMKLSIVRFRCPPIAYLLYSTKREFFCYHIFLICFVFCFGNEYRRKIWRCFVYWIENHVYRAIELREGNRYSCLPGKKERGRNSGDSFDDNSNKRHWIVIVYTAHSKTHLRYSQVST